MSINPVKWKITSKFHVRKKTEWTAEQESKSSQNTLHKEVGRQVTLIHTEKICVGSCGKSKASLHMFYIVFAVMAPLFKKWEVCSNLRWIILLSPDGIVYPRVLERSLSASQTLDSAGTKQFVLVGNTEREWQKGRLINDLVQWLVEEKDENECKTFHFLVDLHSYPIVCGTG